MIQTKEGYNVYMNFYPNIKQLGVIAEVLNDHAKEGLVLNKTLNKALTNGMEIFIRGHEVNITEVKEW